MARRGPGGRCMGRASEPPAGGHRRRVSGIRRVANGPRWTEVAGRRGGAACGKHTGRAAALDARGRRLPDAPCASDPRTERRPQARWRLPGPTRRRSRATGRHTKRRPPAGGRGSPRSGAWSMAGRPRRRLSSLSRWERRRVGRMPAAQAESRHAWLMQTDDVIDLARRLIAIDSVNPTLVPGGAGEHEIARFVERWAAESGLASRVIPSPDGRPNLVIGDTSADVGEAGTGAAGAATSDAPILMLNLPDRLTSHWAREGRNTSAANASRATATPMTAPRTKARGRFPPTTAASRPRSRPRVGRPQRTTRTRLDVRCASPNPARSDEGANRSWRRSSPSRWASSYRRRTPGRSVRARASSSATSADWSSGRRCRSAVGLADALEWPLRSGRRCT